MTYHTKGLLISYLIEQGEEGASLTEIAKALGLSKGYVSRLMIQLWRDCNSVYRTEEDYRKNVKTIRYFWTS